MRSPLIAQALDAVMGKRLHLLITDPEHPHFGDRGYIQVSPEGTVTVSTLLGGPKMVRVELTTCSHGGSACYVEQKPGAVQFTPEKRA